jgi:hypothetical protein
MDQALTLYLDLEPGAKPDLATVARAALAFDATVKEIAFVIDPSLSVRLELKSGTEGSLKLNSLLRAVKDRADARTLGTIAFVVLGWFASDIRSMITQNMVEDFIRGEETLQLSDEEVSRIAKSVVEALNGKVGKREVEKVYQELQRDERIRGVGVTTNPDKKPRIIVPRAEFDDRSRTGSEEIETLNKRTRTNSEMVTLISPVLLPGGRKWRFSAGQVEFGASVKDEDFLASLLSGRESVAMVAGITMSVTLETKEENVGGVWVVKERNILKVHGTKAVPIQQSFPLPPTNE